MGGVQLTRRLFGDSEARVRLEGGLRLTERQWGVSKGWAKRQ